MSSINRPIHNIISEPAVVNRVFDYHDRVRWGSIIAGFVIALATQLVLSALGTANGLSLISSTGAPRSNAPGIFTWVGIWVIISVFISLFVGSWVTARASGPMTRSTAILNGTIFWATTLVISSWLVTSGVTGVLSVVTSNAGAVINQAQQSGVNVLNNVPNVTAQQAREIASSVATAGWTFIISSLLGLVASLIGASIGTRSPRTHS
jgi:hypothetical protein